MYSNGGLQLLEIPALIKSICCWARIKITLKLHDKIFKQLQVQNKILESEFNFLEFIFGFLKIIKKYHEKNLSLLHQFYLIRNFLAWEHNLV